MRLSVKQHDYGAAQSDAYKSFTAKRRLRAVKAQNIPHHSAREMQKIKLPHLCQYWQIHSSYQCAYVEVID